MAFFNPCIIVHPKCDSGSMKRGLSDMLLREVSKVSVLLGQPPKLISVSFQSVHRIEARKSYSFNSKMKILAQSMKIG